MKTSTLKRPLAKIGPCNFISIANLAYYNFLDRVVISLTIFTVYCDWPLKTLEVFQMLCEIRRVEPVVVLRRPWGRWTLSWSLHYFPLLFVLFLPQKGNEIYVSFSSLRLLSNGIIHNKQGASYPIKLKGILTILTQEDWVTFAPRRFAPRQMLQDICSNWTNAPWLGHLPQRQTPKTI